MYGGCFDPEFEDDSRQFFREVAEGRYVLLFSPTVVRELADAPVRLKQVLDKLPRQCLELTQQSEEVRDLVRAYIEFGVVSRPFVSAGEHVASATVAGADLAVTWDYKHILQVKKIMAYEAIDVLRGYTPPRLASPSQLVQVQKMPVCVEMKWEIQRRLKDKYEGVPEEEARRIQMEKILADPVFGPLFRDAVRPPHRRG